MRQGRIVRSRTYYILGYDCRIFQNVSVQDPRHNSNHLIVVGYLRGVSTREHYRYLGSRTRLQLRPPQYETRTWAEKLFTVLRRAVPKPDTRTACHNSWISLETWRLIDERVSTRRDPGRDHRRLRRLGRTIKESLKEDRRRRVTTTGEEVESLLTRDPPLPHEYLRRMRGWY